MSDKKSDFASAFKTATTADWEALATKALKGASLDKLTTRTLDGLTIKPLYTAADWPAQDQSGVPGKAPFARGASHEGDWEICQPIATPEPTDANNDIQSELAAGASGVVLNLSNAALSGDFEAAGAAPGLAAQNISDFARTLKDVALDLVPVHFFGGVHFGPLAAMLRALAEEADLNPGNAEFRLHADPLGALAETGALPADMDTCLAWLQTIAEHFSASGHNLRAVGVDTRPYHNAGATEAQEIAYALATGTEYLRVLTKEGKAPEDVARFTFTLVCDADFFLSIAKLRSFQRCWGQVLSAIWPDIEALPHELQAITSKRMMTRRDVTVNMLRTTSAAFAAAVGGADSIAVLPFTERFGLPTEFSRRMARNVQIILEQESHIARAQDPVGGAYALESLTDDLAKRAWGLFQEIEAGGGMSEALTSGKVQTQIAAVAEERRKAIAKRKLPLTGVSEFPAIEEKTFETQAIDSAKTQARLKQQTALNMADKTGITQLEAITGKTGPALFDAMTDAARAGATMSDIAAKLAATPVKIDPLPVRMLDEDFEALRIKSDALTAKSGTRPAVFLANIGPIAAFTARATFAKAFFEAGGIETIGTDGFDDPADAASAFSDCGAPLAVLCSSDPLYKEHGPAFAHAIKQAGARMLFFAGRPGDLELTLSEAGVDEFVFVGADVAATLERAYHVIGGDQ